MTPAISVAVGVDLGGTNARAALVEVESGRFVGTERRRPVGQARAPEAIADLVQALVEEADPDGRRAGVGIGFAGMLRGWTGVVANAPNFGLREVDLRTPLRARLGPAVELYNDLNAIAYGEYRYGAGRGARDLLCVYVGTGVGAGLVLDGRVFIGATHLAGEFGHVKVVPGGRLCGCGARGCLEAYVSGANLTRRAMEELDSDGSTGRRTSAAVALAGSVAAVHAGHLDEAARRGDPYALALWNEITPLFGAALANAVTLLNPSRVVLGGTAWEGAPELRRLVLEHYVRMVNAPSGEAAVLVDTVLGDAAGVLGAAALASEGVITE